MADASSPVKYPLLHKPSFIILMLIVVFPFGIFLLWKNTDWPAWLKGALTVAVLAAFSFVVFYKPPLESLRISSLDSTSSLTVNQTFSVEVLYLPHDTYTSKIELVCDTPGLVDIQRLDNSSKNGSLFFQVTALQAGQGNLHAQGGGLTTAVIPVKIQ